MCVLFCHKSLVRVFIKYLLKQVNSKLIPCFEKISIFLLSLCPVVHMGALSQLELLSDQCTASEQNYGNFSQDLNIIIVDFYSSPNTNSSEFRLPMTHLYMIFQSNIYFSLDLLIGHNKM